MNSHKCLALALLLALASPAAAGEWYVKAGASGKGKTKADPMGELWRAMAFAKRGDVIHVTQGEYNGNKGNGEFAVRVPYLTMLGGYTDDFSARHPFKNMTILRRHPSKRISISYSAVGGGIVTTGRYRPGEDVHADNLIFDGFVLDGSTRNKYGEGQQLGKLITQSSWKSALFDIGVGHPTSFSAMDITIRNCVFANGYFEAIRVPWQGDKNEISNCVVVSTMLTGINLDSMMPAMNKLQMSATGGNTPPTKVKVKNVTVCYQWRHDKADMGHGLTIGKAGSVDIRDSVFAWTQKGEGVKNQKQNKQVHLEGNLFWMNPRGPYTYADAKAQSSLAGEAPGDDEEEEEEEEEPSESGGSGGHVIKGNVVKDPGFEPDLPFWTNFSGWSMSYGEGFPKSIDALNAARKARGLKTYPKFGEPIPPLEKLWGFAYPLDKIFPTLLCKADKTKGIQFDGPFATYKERTTGVMGETAGKKDEYVAITWEDLTGKAKLKELDGKKIKIKIALGAMKVLWHLQDKGVGANDYISFEGYKPGITSPSSSDKIMVYAVYGTNPAKRYVTYGNRKERKKSWPKGVWVRGILHSKGFGKCPYSLVVDYMGKP